MSIIAVERALIILKQMSLSSNGVSIREVARTLGYNPAVVQKSMQALVSQGFAEQDDVSQHYHLGPAALQVGLTGLAKLEIRQTAHPHLEALTKMSGETSLLGVRHGDVAVYIDKVVSPSEIRLDPPLGIRRPFNCTAVGKALVASLSDAEFDRLSQSDAFIDATPTSITDIAQLKQQIARIRESDLAVDQEEFIPGAMCLAAPVRNHEGVVVAAIAVAGPVHRVNSNYEKLASQVVSCAKDISAALGYRHEK